MTARSTTATAPETRGTPPRRPRRRLTTRWRAIIAILVLGLVSTACSGSDSADDSADTSEAFTAADTSEAVAVEDSAAGDGDGGATEAGFGLAAEEPAADAEATTTTSSLESPTTPPGTAITGERIIKEGTVTLQVQPGDFDAAFGQVITRAQTLGGHVAGSSSSTDDDGLISGQVTLRVPVRAFEDLLTAVGDSGELIDRNVTSQDVSAEFTDLSARQRHLQAQERFYLGLLDEAASINDAIVIQQQLEGIQGQIERITGQLNLLQDRSSFSTLTVRIRERGADAATADEVMGPSLATYWANAQDVLINTVGAILVALTFSLPFLLMALLAYGVWRVARRRRSGEAAPARPAPLATPASVERAPATVGAPPSSEEPSQQS